MRRGGSSAILSVMSREIWVRIKVANVSDPNRSAEVRAFVDNGSTDSALPAALLQRLGIRPEGAERYEIWGNRTVRRRWGHARFEILGRTGIGKVTFEAETELPMIGATTLEDLGFDIDMGNGGLRPFRRRGPHIRRRPHHALKSGRRA